MGYREGVKPVKDFGAQAATSGLMAWQFGTKGHGGLARPGAPGYDHGKPAPCHRPDMS